MSQSSPAEPFADHEGNERLRALGEALGVDVRPAGRNFVVAASAGTVLAPRRQAAASRLLASLADLRSGTHRTHRESFDLEQTLARRTQELDLLYRLSRDAANHSRVTLDYARLVGDVAANLGKGIVWVSLMVRDFTFVGGHLGAVSGEELRSAELDWESLGTRVLLECLQNELAAVQLAAGTLPELEKACGMPLASTCLPVVVGDRTVGFAALLLEPAGDGTAPRQRLGLLHGLAHHVSLTLGTVQQRSELQSFLFNTVKSLVAAVDAKDPYTRGHSERVHYLAVRTGQELGLGGEEMQDLSWAALLHDIGKLSIPDAILRKSASLSDEEWALIKRHPENGCQVIEPIPQLANARPAIRHHHEHFAGTGYPDGLAGDEIPLLARVVAVADAFDAITSARTYTDPQSCEQGLRTLEENGMTRFDPVVIAAVRAVVEREVSEDSFAFEPQRDRRAA